MAAASLGWAIAGTGGIARSFAADMRFSKRGRVVAVASAAGERARTLAAAIGPDVASGDLDAALRNPAVGAVYVAGRNENHCEQALRCLAAGKPVLVEKPFATTPEDADRIREAAAAAGLLAMEAMWMRFTPGIRRLKALIDDGALGPLRSMQASLAFPNPTPSASPLLDLGVYPVSLAVHLLGSPRRIAVAGTRDQVGLVVSYPGAVGSIICGFAAQGANTLSVVGENAVLSIGSPFFRPSLLTIRRTGDAVREASATAFPALPPAPRFAAARALLRPLKDRRIPTLFEGTGLQYQADHFAECLAGRLTESPVMPLSESIEVLRIVDEAETLLADQADSARTLAGSKVETGR